MINQFTQHHRFLSNFFPAKIVKAGIVFPSVEHAYQAFKSTSRPTQLWIASRPSPGSAKRAGKGITLRPDWEKVKLPLMLELVREKFRDPHLCNLLLLTGEEELVEGNWWHDNFWGQCLKQNCTREKTAGENHLGKILMRVRREIRDAEEKRREEA